ncbi:MAG: MFS transporter [Candidatus Limnocylindrales bacterium]
MASPAAESAPTHTPDVPAALAEPTRRVGVRFVGLLSLASLGLWAAFFTPIQVLLPEQLEAIDPINKVFWLSVVTGLGALVAVVANPLAGALSDRTTLRFGRRNPWTLGCAIAGALALVALSQASAVWLVLVGWCLAQASLNGMLASLTAMVPDQVPVEQRGEVSAWVGIPGPVGLVIGVALVTSVVTGIVAGYTVIAIFVFVAAVPLVLAVRDERLPRAFRPSFSWRSFIAGFWIDPRVHPDFGWAWITRFLVSLGNSLGTLYLLYFLKDAVHYEQRYGGKADDALLVLILIYTACLLVTAIAGGIWSDRVKRRKVFVMVATGIMAAGAVVLAILQTWEAAIVAAAVMGAGYGTYLAVDQALITQVLPAAESRAKDLGVINIANSLPQVLGPAMAGPVIAGLGGYPSLYWLTAVVTLLGAVLVQPIKSVR